jgi:hypothetical protein
MQVDGMRRETGRGKGKETQGYDFEGFRRRTFAVKIDVKERKRLDSSSHEMVKTNMEDSL